MPRAEIQTSPCSVRSAAANKKHSAQSLGRKQQLDRVTGCCAADKSMHDSRLGTFAKFTLDTGLQVFDMIILNTHATCAECGLRIFRRNQIAEANAAQNRNKSPKQVRPDLSRPG